MENAGLQERRDKLQKLLNARKGHKEYKENCKAIRSEIEKLDAAIARLASPSQDENNDGD
jgi:hypothetical protein